MTPEQQEATLAVLRRIAPPDSTGGWHYEDCGLDAEEWKREQVYRNAWRQTVADRGPLPSMAPLEADPADRLRAMTESASWFRHHELHIRDLMQYVHDPTDDELCEDGCVYPEVRRLLAEIDDGDQS